MVVRKRHTEGFTVAEVLLAVAIILVLAAIAVPAIMTAQTNMRLVELDNAAAQIANAAQTQMTAKKANGTWLSLVEKTDDAGKATYHFPEAQNPPGGASADKRYMTADQARQNGIVPGLSIDDTVREGDYIIESTPTAKLDFSTAPIRKLRPHRTTTLPTAPTASSRLAGRPAP